MKSFSNEVPSESLKPVKYVAWAALALSALALALSLSVVFGN